MEVVTSWLLTFQMFWLFSWVWVSIWAHAQPIGHHSLTFSFFIKYYIFFGCSQMFAFDPQPFIKPPKLSVSKPWLASASDQRMQWYPTSEQDVWMSFHPRKCMRACLVYYSKHVFFPVQMFMYWFFCEYVCFCARVFAFDMGNNNKKINKPK